jgi:hypothetical protein
MRKLRYFACHNIFHYASQCPKKKNKNKEMEMETSTSTEIDEFAEKFKDEFSLVASLLNNNKLVELEECYNKFCLTPCNLLGWPSISLCRLEIPFLFTPKTKMHIFLLDTPTTLRWGGGGGVVNECGDLFPKTSLLHKNSLVNIQHFLITHCCHL